MYVKLGIMDQCDTKIDHIKYQCDTEIDHIKYIGWLGRAMVLGCFQCQGVLLLWHMVGQGPAVLAAGVGRVGFFSSPEPKAHLVSL